MTGMQRSLRLSLLEDMLAVCRLDADAPVPSWALAGSLVSVTRTREELSVVCLQDVVPAAFRCERGWQCLRVVATLDFAMTGVLASLVVPLAEAGISVFALSTFDTDYILIKADQLPKAMEVLRGWGHTVD